MTQGLSSNQLAADPIRLKAVTYDFQCVSEAAIHLVRMDPEVPERHPRVPWTQICSLANVIRHAYGQIELNVLWETAMGRELTDLLDAAEAELISSATAENQPKAKDP